MRSAGTYRLMSSGRPVARGMGDALPSMQQSGFFTVDCSQWLSWIGNPVCWDHPPAYWAQMNAVATAAGPLPQPAPPTGPSNIQQETVPGAFTPEMGIAGGAAATQQKLQDYFGGAATSISNIPSAALGGDGSSDGGTPTAPNLTVIAIAAIAVAGLAALSFAVGGRRR